MALPINEGDVVAEKYVVERVIGSGGMGVVVSAMNVKLDQRVALKFLLETASQHAEIVQRFVREARAAAKIQCDHVARVIDVSALPGGEPFIVMEYMEGEDLQSILDRTRVLSVEDTVGFTLQACEALAEAHALGIVHRDVKPGNLFLARRPNGEPIVKVLDFGISKSVSPVEDAGNLTRTTSIMGSPLYMSPEQMTSAKHVDARSDVWSVGVVMHQFLSGEPPFTGEGLPNLVLAIMHNTPPHLRVPRPDVPQGLDDAIRRCLEKDPAQRFQNVAELAAAIAPFGPARASISVDRISHVLGTWKNAELATADTIERPLGQFVLPAAPTPVAVAAVASEPVARSRPDVTNPLWTNSLDGSGEPKLPKKALPWGLLGLGGVAVAALVAFGLRASGPDAASQSPTSASATGLVMPLGTVSPAPSGAPTAPTAVAPPDAPARGLPSAVSSAASSPSARATAPATTPAPPAAPPPTPRSAVAPPPRSPKQPAAARTEPGPAAPDCSVPFTLDGAGHRVPRPECL